MFHRSRTRFHDKNLQKRGATFSLRSFERTIRATVLQLAWQEQVTFFLLYNEMLMMSVFY
jgi:hypothetical protein